jgi:hypothetical protein
MTDVAELMAFVRACLDEDERVARAANGPRWKAGDGNVSEGGLYALRGSGDDGWSIAWFDLGTANEADDGTRQLPRWPKMQRHAQANADHAARHDPARVLAQVAAKRALLAELAAANMVFAMRLLAEPYAGRPGWREEWRTWTARTGPGGVT